MKTSPVENYELMKALYPEFYAMIRTPNYNEKTRTCQMLGGLRKTTCVNCKCKIKAHAGQRMCVTCRRKIDKPHLRRDRTSS